MNKIKDEDLKIAAGFALIEAKKWSSVVRMITRNGYEKERACLQVLAIEIYLKSILMCEGVNISKIDNKKENKHNDHYIYDLYNRMSKEIKEQIKNEVDFIPVYKIDSLGEEIKCDLDTFEKCLQSISNNFVDLRYEYEKFVNGKPILAMCDFIEKVEIVIKKLAQEIYEKTII